MSPLRQAKCVDEEKLALERAMYRRRHTLVASKSLCTGCGICRVACPKEAIELVPRENGNKAREGIPPFIDVDSQKCNFCGICDILCPFGAVKVAVNDEHILSVLDSESFPKLIRDLKIMPSKCDPGCTLCVDACPLSIVEVRHPKPGATRPELVINEEKCNLCGLCSEVSDSVKIVDNKLQPNGDYDEDDLCVEVCPQGALSVKMAPEQPSIKILEERCPTCKWCEVACPTGAIQARKAFSGTMEIHQEKCPEGCKLCLEACPVEAIYLREDGKVDVDENFCTYCGACLRVCPEQEALSVKMTGILHTPVKSGAWNKALEKLTSTIALKRELRAKSAAKLWEAVKNRTP